MSTISIRDVSLYVKVIGQGYPLLLMHGGPGLDHTTMRPFSALADRFTLVFYDHRCNGRSDGAGVTSMTWENLTADAEALRQSLGFEKWAVLGHSFGGMVALEYALRYPESVSHLLLLDSCGDSRWVQEHAPEMLAKRGYSGATVETARRFFNGQVAPNEVAPSMMKLGKAYYHHLSPLQLAHDAFLGLRMKTRPEALIYGYSQLLKGWTVMDRLGEIKVPALVLAGRDDFQFPPEHQAALAGGIANARLEIVERAGHNAPTERTSEVIKIVRRFMASNTTPCEAIDAYVERERRRLKMPSVSLAIVEGDQIVHMRGFGRARPEDEAPTPQTPFFIGSLTKSVTALAVMQLVEAGKIELDAPVQHYLPWFRVADPEPSVEMTVRQLLNQTSGLPTLSGEIQLADFDARPGAAERQARALSTLELSRAPGATFEYSNANYNLLGLIIEAATGKSYADYVQEQIFAPLGMRRTYTSPALAKQNSLALGHQYRFGVPFAASKTLIPPGALAGGGLISTAEDMARLLIAFLNGGRSGDGQILSPSGIEELQRAAVEFSVYGISFQYGMGWFVDEIGGTKLLWHSGTNPDFASYMALLPEQKKGVVLLFNACHHWMNPVLSEVAGGVAALLAGEQLAPMPFRCMMPWLLRGQLLIPGLQIAGVAATLRLLRGLQRDPELHPRGRRAWGLHLLLPLIPNLLGALTLIPMLGKRRGYLRLYMPDYSLIAMVWGSLGVLWSFLGVGLVLRAFVRPLGSTRKHFKP